MKRLDKATDAQLRQIMAGKATTVREIVAASLERGARFRVTTEYGVFLFEVTGFFGTSVKAFVRRVDDRPINPVIAMEPLRRGEYAMPDRIEAGNRFSYSAITVLNNNEAPVLLPRKMSPSIKLELLE